MSIADLYNVPETDTDMAKWSALHQAQHRVTNHAILQTYSIALPEYILDPIDLADPQAFLNQHQTWHNTVDEILGLSGYDLSEVDWSDAGQRAGWIFLNAQLHVQEAQALGAF
jgi:hypothetical protein